MKTRTKRLLREFNFKAERLREYREDMNFKFKHMRDYGMLSDNKDNGNSEGNEDNK